MSYAHIEKCPETMSAKERVRRTFAHEITDRVTIGYETNGGIHARLCAALGLRPEDWDGLRDALGVDYVGVGAPYVGPQLHPVPEGRMVNQLEGAIMRWVEHETGGYWDFCDFPLKDAADEAFETFPIPDPDNFDYNAAREAAKVLGRRYAIYVGDCGTPDIINSNGRIMGMEDVLCHLIMDDDAAMDFMRRRAESQFRVMERTLDACRGLVDFVWLGEDLGTQIAPMIGLDLYRRQMKPIHRRFVDLARSYDLPVQIHTCGSSSRFYEDFIEMGVTGVDTLQPEAVNMSPAYLCEHFGGRLCFRGCISTAGPLAFGTPDDVTRVCRETLAQMMPYRGYHFAPTHAIQDNTPTENVIAMYQAAHTFGRY